MAILGTLKELSGTMPMKNCKNIIIERSVIISFEGQIYINISKLIIFKKLILPRPIFSPLENTN